MLVKRSRLEPAFDKWADKNRSDFPAAVRIVVVRFVKDDDQQSVFLERWILDQRIDVGLEPTIRDIQTAVMGVVASVRRNE
jgi:hypothetical protein